MDFKAQMASGKAIQLLPDGTEQAPFAFDFTLEGKALEHSVDENGDLWIAGYASDFEVDRQDEAFEPGAFERGLKTFLAVNPIMLYHHQYDKALGVFTEGEIRPEGLWVKGRVDKPAPGSWAEDVFNKIRRGTIKSFSVGGLFRRRMTAKGMRIFDCDLGEISITPFPVNPRTTFSLVAKKAFETKAEEEVVKSDAEIAAEEAAAAEAQAAADAQSEEAAAAEAQAAADAKAEEERLAAEAAEKEEPEIKLGSITGEHIVAGSITVEHLSDDLRGRVATLNPEMPTIESAHERLGTLASQLEQVFNQIGMSPTQTQGDVQAG